MPPPAQPDRGCVERSHRLVSEPSASHRETDTAQTAPELLPGEIAQHVLRHPEAHRAATHERG